MFPDKCTYKHDRITLYFELSNNTSFKKMEYYSIIVRDTGYRPIHHNLNNSPKFWHTTWVHQSVEGEGAICPFPKNKNKKSLYVSGTRIANHEINSSKRYPLDHDTSPNIFNSISSDSLLWPIKQLFSIPLYCKSTPIAKCRKLNIL